MSKEVTPVSRALADTSYPPNLIPSTPMVEKRTYAAAMSYVGFTRRVTAWIRKVGTTPLSASLAWSAGALAIAAMWFVILPAYYFVTLVIFGWLMIPFRLVRRSHRKQEHLQQQQLATMQALLVNQQAALRDQDR
jgi:hypothetical protein